MKHALRPLWQLVFVFMPLLLGAQPEVFTRSDFELRGPVQSSTVITDYGEERFEFDREGKLLKTLTRFSDTDYDITYYRYRQGALTERRDEVYRDGTFDKTTSFARFYQRDTTAGTLTETITSYDQQMKEQLTYSYDSIGRIRKIVRIGQEGIDETQVAYSEHQGEETAEYFLNGQLSKSIRRSETNTAGETTTTELVREYFQGAPQKALEQTRDSKNRLLQETRFTYDSVQSGFRKEQTRVLTYNDDGFLGTETISYLNSRGQVSRVSENRFLYQKDGKTPGNWIRKVITPENSIIARRIAYFEEKPVQAADSIPGN
ncbi:MAG: hypothetical protein R3252_11040 [Robiginitalea sp.]|nr:hypothetical protein [Robiginitalea sp.]